jgi:hypothetical protein
MLPDAAKLAVEVAIATATVSAVCCPVSETYEIIIPKAGLGMMEIQTEGANGQMVVMTPSDARTLIVWPDDLKIGIFRYIPQHGDAWSITLPNGHKIKAECAPFPPERHWKWTDRFQTARRIHLKIFED